MPFPLTIAEFVERFPEFAGQPDDFLQTKLDEAAHEIDADVWGDKAEAGHGWLTASRASASSYGREEPIDGRSSYAREYWRLQQLVGRSYRLALP